MVSYTIIVSYVVVLIHLSGGVRDDYELYDTDKISKLGDILLHNILKYAWKSNVGCREPRKTKQQLGRDFAKTLVKEHSGSIFESMQFIDAEPYSIVLFPGIKLDSADLEDLVGPKKHINWGLQQFTEELMKLLKRGIVAYAFEARWNFSKLIMCAVVITANSFLCTYQNIFRTLGQSCNLSGPSLPLDTKHVEYPIWISAEAILRAMIYSEQKQGNPSFLNGIVLNSGVFCTHVFEAKVDPKNHKILAGKTKPFPKMRCMFGRKPSFASVLLKTGELYVVGCCSETRLPASFCDPTGTPISSNAQPQPQQSEIPNKPGSDALAVRNNDFDEKLHQGNNTGPMNNAPVEDVLASTPPPVGHLYTDTDVPVEKK